MIPLMSAGFLMMLLALNLFASLQIARDTLSLPAEKLGQLLLVWLIPLAGSLLILHLLRREPDRSAGHYGEDADPKETMEALQEGIAARGDLPDPP